MNLYDDIRLVKGVGPAKAGELKKLNIETVEDLLFHFFPRSYDVYMPPVEVSKLRNGYVETVEAVITERPKLITKGSKKIVTLRIYEGANTANLIWFNQPYIAKTLVTGSRFLFRGRVSGSGRAVSLTQPEVIRPEAYMKKLSTMQPVYHLTQGLSNNFIIKLIGELREVFAQIDDYLTPSQRRRYSLISRSAAIDNIHSPIDVQAYRDARRRLVFDEFTQFAASMRAMHRQELTCPNKYNDVDFGKAEEFIRSLPYELTGAQKRALDEIKADMKKNMLSTRLLQGDVGCGKTVVAMYALCACVSSGHQACILAPTEVLARQHYEEFCRELGAYGIETVLLVGSLSKGEKDRIHASIASGKNMIVVGTHALIQEAVHFTDLGCAVIDEQHRFGVKQREFFTRNGLTPYVLVMSATPIPRSLAMVLYTDMNVTVIDEMPACRLPIKNCVVSSDKRTTSFNFIAGEVEKGHQAYIICPMIEESEELDVENVTDYSEMLKKYYEGRKIRVGYLHGRLGKDEKDEVLDKFYNHEIDVLVSTTVVEVGVNVPNATVMMVENAERFGLAQLHQLRGRVGRGGFQSYCIFIKGSESDVINERLDILVKYNDGMLVAQKDMELRGPGDFFGVRQSGQMDFKLGDISTDADIYTIAAEYISSLDDETLRSIFTVKKENIVI